MPISALFSNPDPWGGFKKVSPQICHKGENTAMQTVKQILEHYDIQNPVQDMELGERYEIPADLTSADMDLTIEKVRSNEISVAHYYKQRGDLMRDPEIVYRVEDGEWIPVEYTQDPGIYQRDETGLPSVEDFAETWDENLRRQGFLQVAQNRGENQ